MLINRFCSKLNVKTPVIISVCIIACTIIFSPTTNAATVSQVRARSILSFGMPVDSSEKLVDFIIKDDEILAQVYILESGTGIGSNNCYHDCKEVTLTTKSGNSITFKAGSKVVISNINGVSKIDYLPASSIPVSIKEGIQSEGNLYIPMNYVYDHIGTDRTFLYDASSNTIWSGMYKNQKAFLTDFKYQLKGCSNNALDWNSHSIIFEKYGKFGLVDYFSADTAVAAKRIYNKYKIVAQPEYDEISCVYSGSHFLVLKKGAIVKLYNLNTGELSTEFDSAMSMVGVSMVGDSLSEDEINLLSDYRYKYVKSNVIDNRSVQKGALSIGARIGGNLGEFYVVKKNEKYGYINSNIKTEVVYDRVEVRSGSTSSGDMIEEHSEVFLYKNNRRYAVMGNAVVDYEDVLNSEKVMIMGLYVALPVVVGCVFIFIIGLIAGVIFLRKARSAKLSPKHTTKV